jgi:hypothetical protein
VVIFPQMKDDARDVVRDSCCWFDNRMLQVKKQLRVGACGLVRSFPLLYSVIIREKLCGQTNADSPTAGHRRPEQRNQEATTHRKQLLNP